jgi:integrase
MGSLVNRGDAQRAVVRINGVNKAKTFPRTKEGTIAARRWIIEQEADAVKTSRLKTGLTIAEVMVRMRLEELKKPYHCSNTSLFATLAVEFGPVDLSQLTAAWWVEKAMAWQGKDGKGIKPASRGSKLIRIFSALKRASKLWRNECEPRFDEMKIAWEQLVEMKAIGKPRARTRRVSPEEIVAIKEQIGVSSLTALPLADIIDVALTTGMRRGELMRVTWADLNTVKGKPMLWIRNRKHPKEKVGNDQNIPLLGKSAAIIKRQAKKLLENGKFDERIFPFCDKVVGRHFQQCALGAGIKGIHFHDMRHEAITLLFEQGYSIPEVCNVSGHKNWECLKIYTQLDGADMHKGPLAKRAA